MELGHSARDAQWKARYEEALARHKAGDLVSARDLYRNLLTNDADNSEVLHLLGLTNYQLNVPQDAVQPLMAAVRIEPGNPQYLNNLGLALAAANRFDEAEKLYRDLLAKHPNYIEGFNNFGKVLREAGRLVEAKEFLRRAINMAPAYVHAYVNLAAIADAEGQSRQKKEIFKDLIAANPKDITGYVQLAVIAFQEEAFGEAAKYFEKALRISPQQLGLKNNLGLALSKQGDLDRAERLFREILVETPDYVDALSNLGGILRDKFQFQEAIDVLKRAIACAPEHINSLNTLGNVYADLQQFTEAVQVFEHLLRIQSDYLPGINNLANACRASGQLQRAKELFERALKTNPDQPQIISNYALALQDLGEYAQAKALLRSGMQTCPNDADIRWNLSLACLMDGEYSEGWPLFESRFDKRDWKQILPFTFSQPRWQGEPFAGKRVLVQSEQGIGDVFQFVRFIPQVKALGGEVIFSTKAALVPLLRDFPGIDKLIVREGKDPLTETFDYYVPLLSLPKVLGVQEEGLQPLAIPYLHADETLVPNWRARFSADAFNIGFVWGGNPKFKNDFNRSATPDIFKPLSTLSGVRLYSLQKGRDHEIRDDSWFENVAPELHSFADTAAAIECLDLIISVDTSVLHLAGAMGKATMGLIVFNPDWRWLLNRDDSPWYSGMQLFRQQSPRDWHGVMTEVLTAVRARVAQSG